jgi:hypothetical protein
MIMANISAKEAESPQALVRSSERGTADKAGETRNGAEPAVNNTTRTSSVPNPLPGSIMDAIRKTSKKHILVDALFWMPYHLTLLRVRVRLSDTLDGQQLFLRCADLGKVPRQSLARVLHYPYSAERDENLARLVQGTVSSFQQRLRSPIFNIKYQ